jgi:hypothetical protein
MEGGGFGMDTGEGNGYQTCMRCGKLMPAGASFCNSCGADLSAMPAPGLQGAVSPAQFAGALQSGRVPEAAGPPVNYPAMETTLYPTWKPGAPPFPPQQAALAYQHQPMLYRQRKTDGLAIASLICAVASFALLPLLPAVAAITMGFVSRERIRKSEGELDGDGIALAGILVGLANVVLIVAVMLIALIVVLSQ